jgi:hypothetical protein
MAEENREDAILRMIDVSDKTQTANVANRSLMLYRLVRSLLFQVTPLIFFSVAPWYTVFL